MKKHPHLSRLFIGCALAMSTQAMGAGFTQTQGALSTLGQVSHPGTILSLKNNPASGELLIGLDESVRLGFAAIGYQAEFGAIDNFLEDAEDLADAMEDDDLDLGQALDLKEDFDALLPQLGQDGRLTQQGSFQLLPVAFRSETLGGVITMDLGFNGQLDARFLDDPLDIRVINEQVNLITSSSIYVKSAAIATASIGYSREVWQSSESDNKLYAGASVNFHTIGLNKQLLALQNLIDGEDIESAIEDEFDQNSETTSAVGIDLGLLYTTPNAQIGISVLNANEPEAEYGTIGVDCMQFSDNAARQSNCIIAQQTFSDRIALTETAVLTAKTVVEGAFYTEDKAWAIAASADVNSTYDLVGRESQYVNVSASYSSDGYILPSIRFGASKNLVGSELTTVSAGATFFGMLNFDLNMSLERVEVDGTEVPRVFGFSLGLEEKF